MGALTLRPMLGIIAIFSVLIASPHAIAKNTVKDLAFGVALFHHYQEDYFPALLSLEVGETQQRLSNNSDEADILRAGLYLAYGMHRNARVQIEPLVGSLSPEVATKARYLLGRQQFQFGHYALANEQFSQLNRSLLNDQLAPYLHTYGMSLSYTQNATKAVDIFNLVPKKERTWRAYSYFNAPPCCLTKAR